MIQLRFAAPLLTLLTLITAGAASAQIVLPGTYRVRAGAQVLGCGGLAPRCDTATLEGTIDLAVALPDEEAAQGEIFIEISDSDLILRTDGSPGTAFPGPSNLPLIGLNAVLELGQFELADDDGNQSVELLLQPVNDQFQPTGSPPNLLLQGVYDEGCCDRFVYQILGALLEPTENSTTLLLDGDAPDRFEVTFDFDLPSGAEGAANPVRYDGRSGGFWIFTADNPEVFVKVIDACSTEAASIWVFAAGLTNLESELTVTDRFGTDLRTYSNPPQTPFDPILDTAAFPCLDL